MDDAEERVEEKRNEAPEHVREARAKADARRLEQQTVTLVELEAAWDEYMDLPGADREFATAMLHCINLLRSAREED